MERFLKFLSSYKGSIVLMLIYSFGLATATIVEKQLGTQAAKMLIYYSPLFILLQLLLAINFLIILFNSNYIKSKRWGLIIIHLSLTVILGGALTTFLFGKEGQVHIREGEKSDQMVMHTSKGVKTEKLPFVLELKDFRLNRYPGSNSPSSYESTLLVYVDNDIREVSVFMNNVLDLKGYRFFQASYDKDELGTVLSVNKDVAGRTITYTGYILLLIGFILMFLMPGSRFRKLGEQLKDIRARADKLTLVFLLSLISLNGFSQNNWNETKHTIDIIESIKDNAIPVEHAEKFGALPVQFRGRVMPLNTFSSEILRKIHNETNIYNLNSDQFLLSLLVNPEKWSHAKIISGDQSYLSYNQFFDEGGSYSLLNQLQQIYNQPADKRNESEKDLIKLDEKVNILYQLFTHIIPGIFPHAEDPSHTWYNLGDNLSVYEFKDSVFITDSFNNYLAEVRLSLQSNDWSKPDEILNSIKEYQLSNDKASLIRPDKIEAELKYNRLNIFNYSKLGYFILGGLLLILAFIRLMNRKTWLQYASTILIIGIAAIFIYHLFGMGMRWYISGYAPWSNSYETMVYVAWATVLAGFIFGRKNILTLSLATLFGGVILFVSSLNWMDPQINTLVPVLNSPWLMFHVAVIVAAYGFFGISFLLGLTNIIIMSFNKASSLMALRIKELSVINNMSLLTGLALMTIGTFLGAVWANESWGRYWGWDPKETWALITIIVYSVVTHLHLVKKWNSDWLFNFTSVLGFSSVLMTYLGVNYFLSGMHSYGQTDTSSSVFVYIAIVFTIIVILGFLSYNRRSKFIDS
ncbi:MAG TPA: cytochrome c biogenesis protein CcsA [Fermentimonas caenicola]|jgi:cytochrome c-type biogenesis protein CcsB|uniref:cytochrome c biogenesis protein CcsA n=1 Tax=Lascolabacillus sp. TaxID=1924068 RepID=UPI0012001970|nr:cytochrome c biogenesis protein CcsA [Lascolabacillus sp.]MBP6174940.1 cytochrome c biogenesis protein CcsA [Fermentimonas sp.]MDI9625161.1 cytochrome c biogenesis protein CcsA [Bacteroidota bacterium]TAH61776.1 MAG: cytochrome C biogenesis protein [Fermentimonas caenicola]MBP6196114.1 cytochrome c biogenesis protein CcsA [Fermentimonas sp.]MBP7105259.1 cytochrome c biogenesis protein CcsA [Fermentimonas sp.]